MSLRNQSIGLCMIVRNEEAILERCLRSVAGLIDSWVICDTGSEDRTPEIVQSLLADIPGELHETSWLDFGQNRSELMEIAHGSADYLLLIDADMTVQRRASLPPLSSDAYMLRETGGLDFGVLRLVRGDRRWWYEGSTHEYIATDGRFDQRQLDELLIEHHGDGSGRREKLIRDVGLLKRDVARDPDNPRPIFYLAQTYRELGKHEIAIRYYRRRVEMGGWDEEVFYAGLQEGVLRAEQELASGTPVLLDAWQRRPTRAEPLYELARLHRRNGDLAVAHMFATRGLEIPYPSADVLFIHRWVYDWALRLERAQAAAGVGRLGEARDDLRELLDNANLPRDIELLARRSFAELADRRSARTRQPHGRDTERLSELAPSARIGEIKLTVKPDWPCFNPSITSDGEGFRMIVRTANYRIETGVLHAGGVLHNINYLVTLDRGLTVTELRPLIDRADGPRRYPSQIQGYEDCRLIQVGGDWYASATVCDLNPVDRREIALLELNGDEIVSVRALAGPDPARHEKNWMPFVIDGQLHFLYSSGPTVVLRCDPARGKLDPVSDSPASELAAEFRGGSQGVAVDDGYLFVIHEVDHSEHVLRYLHRLVLLNPELRLAAISRPFTFAADRIEFCAGMALHERELVLSFGVSDAAAGLAAVGLDEAMALLEPVARTATTGYRGTDSSEHG
jgi:glycosyltransferase involved in cell wall biosynthesis/predicted GH43/DUF377 family glycosyl hydrolase